MTAGTRAPGPLAALGAVAVALAFLTREPLMLAALAAGAAALAATAPGRLGRVLLVGGAVAGLALAVLNPLVTSDGDHIIARGPEVPVIDLELTVEEIVAGVAMGLRLFAVAALMGAVLAHVDVDRLQAQVARVAPRSALLCALAARLLPTLERDARAVAETARCRGVDLAAGRRLGRVRRAAPLALPLLGSSLERGLDVAEAMAARGYGAPGRTRVAERPWGPRERAVAALAAALAGVAAAAVASGAASFRYYPRIEAPPEPHAAALAAAAAGLIGAAAWVLHR